MRQGNPLDKKDQTNQLGNVRKGENNARPIKRCVM